MDNNETGESLEKVVNLLELPDGAGKSVTEFVNGIDIGKFKSIHLSYREECISKRCDISFLEWLKELMSINAKQEIKSEKENQTSQAE